MKGQHDGAESLGEKVKLRKCRAEKRISVTWIGHWQDKLGAYRGGKTCSKEARRIPKGRSREHVGEQEGRCSECVRDSNAAELGAKGTAMPKLEDLNVCLMLDRF